MSKSIKMSKKQKEKQLDYICDVMETRHDIKCANCRKSETLFNCDVQDAIEQFYKNGWRVKPHEYIYCQKCSEANGVI